MHCIAGAALEELLFSAFVAGIEALVEVHSPQEAKAAVAAGATLLVVCVFRNLNKHLMYYLGVVTYRSHGEV